MRRRILVLVGFILLAGCQSVPPLATPAPVVDASPPPKASLAPVSSPAQKPTVSTQPPPEPSETLPIPTPTWPEGVVTPGGAGCRKPPDDYSRVEVNGEALNQRTLWMLEQAQTLYGGPGDILRVTQGSYTDAEPGSFGTHSGGGAVDISIRNPANPSEILWDEVEAMVAALRLAGFAAWYRPPDRLGAGSPAHIHAISVGDRELSSAAVDQLTGPWGYFRGLDGLPPPLGPQPDPHGGPVICPWMLDLGFRDLRQDGSE